LEAGYRLIDTDKKKKIVEIIKNKLVTKHIIDYYILNSGFINKLINERIRTTFQQLPPVYTKKTKLKSSYFLKLAGYESCK